MANKLPDEVTDYQWLYKYPRGSDNIYSPYYQVVPRCTRMCCIIARLATKDNTHAIVLEKSHTCI